jgi:SPP1 gp7 family putative phage head morphogenesis protein
VKISAKSRGPVPKEALDYFRRKRLAPELDMDAAWPEEHHLAFRVAGVASADLLEAIRRAVERAIAEGLTYRQFAGQLEEVAQALGWKRSDPKKPPWRLRTIYETNMRTARAAGQWERIERTKDTRPYLTYELGPSERHRPHHVAWAGTTLPVDHPWWSSHFPPNGYGCRCRVRALSSAEAERRGVSTNAPEGAPDPGWADHPSSSRRV